MTRSRPRHDPVPRWDRFIMGPWFERIVMAWAIALVGCVTTAAVLTVVLDVH